MKGWHLLYWPCVFGQLKNAVVVWCQLEEDTDSDENRIAAVVGLMNTVVEVGAGLVVEVEAEVEAAAATDFAQILPLEEDQLSELGSKGVTSRAMAS